MSAETETEGSAFRVECTIPILRVEDLKRSLDYYETVLGFHTDWGGGNHTIMASVSRDNCGIMLCEGDQGQSGTWLWIGVTDVRALYETLKSAGARIVQEPINYSWALEMRVEDPDGHVLRIGSEPDPNLPFANGPANR